MVGWFCIWVFFFCVFCRGQWDEEGSVLQNYRSFGVVSNPNLIGALSRSKQVVESESLQQPPAPEPIQVDTNGEIKDPEFQVIDSGSDLEEDGIFRKPYVKWY